MTIMSFEHLHSYKSHFFCLNMVYKPWTVLGKYLFLSSYLQPVVLEVRHGDEPVANAGKINEFIHFLVSSIFSLHVAD